MSRRDRMPIFLWASPPHAHIVEEPPAQTPLEKLISSTQSEEYSGIALEVTNKEWQTRWNSLHPDSEESANENERRGRQVELWRLSDTFRKEEVNVTKLEEADGIIGLASEWLQLDSPNEEVRQDAEVALRQELAYASYLNIATVILPPPRNRQYAADYARAVNACFHNIPPVLNPYLQLSIRIPLRDPRRFTADDRLELSGNVSGNSDDDVAEMWGMWDLIRTVCRYNTRLTVCLDITHPLPTNPSLLTRWNAEPIRYLYIPASAFVSNPGGWPVLPKVTQNFIRDMVKYYPGVILSGVDDGLHGTGGPIAYQKYIRHLEKTSPFVLALEDETSVETFASGYWDYLQAPLQPLMDNLQSATYEVFERDPVKYAQYEQAIYLALCDRPEDEEVVICVAGAGRGPLITRSLKAIYRSNQRARIYAVEKNPSAYVTLQEKREREWGDTVTLLFGDMRVIQVPEKADILVSELLGSFGDNELSPECLDGACRFLKDDGISIPVSYTAYLAPLSSSRLHVEASVTPHEIKNAETPYVVMFQSVNELGVEPQKCWEFHHPRKGATIDAQGLPLTNSHNLRTTHLTFHIPQAGVVHGLAGYFEACLYGEVGLSIHPQRKDDISPRMLSWFPLFFPIKNPLYVPANAELDVRMWRLTDQRKVWYEWFLESFFRCQPLVGTGDIVSRRQTKGIRESPGDETVASPVIDPLTPSEDNQPKGVSVVQEDVRSTRIKIGQSVLHNPGGRSSWIGL